MSFDSVGRQGRTRALWFRVRASFPAFVFITALTSVSASSAQAQGATPAGWVQVTVTDAKQVPVVGAVITIATRPAISAAATAQTSEAGVATLGPVAAGSATVQARRLGFRDGRQDIAITAGDTTRISMILDASAQALGAIRVVALRGDLTPEQQVDRTRIAAVVPHDAAEVLRELPGTDAMRRGGTALDPVVRGLRDTQLGVYVDAARTFPGGPAGMDTPLSHVDPAHVQGMEVISGPYALTWGAGNLSAIRVTTDALPPSGAAPVGARVTSGYDGNLNATEVAGAVFGALGTSGRVRYTAGGAWREGQDYTDGAGRLVQGDFHSREGRAKVGVQTGQNGLFSVLGSKQEQRDIDYPGRPLDAAYFDAYQLQAEWMLRAPRTEAKSLGSLLLRDVDVMAYVYNVDHLMDNDNKPTALPNPNRMPPFAVKVNTWSDVHVLGGRTSVRLDAPRGWEVQVGGDVYHADHNARRQTDRRDNGALVRRDLIWGGAWIMDAGAFVRGERNVGKARVATTVRLDAVRADADSASAFFVAQNGADLSSSELNWSGATTVRIPLSARWALTAGLGSVVRTAEANERFSDRAAAKRAQTNAEFLGNPQLKPERSTQADLWFEGRIARLQVQLNAFARQLDDYITIEATDLPRNQAGSPPPVFRFINGQARYFGGEFLTSAALLPSLVVTGSVAYLRGQDVTLAEPALGVTPLRGDVRARFAPGRASWFVEAAAHLASEQTRVAVTRGEKATSGWSTVDLQSGYTWTMPGARTVGLRIGARNLLDRAYVQHLTALDAFTAGRIAEPGRVLFARMTVGM